MNFSDKQISIIRDLVSHEIDKFYIITETNYELRTELENILNQIDAHQYVHSPKTRQQFNFALYNYLIEDKGLGEIIVNVAGACSEETFFEILLDCIKSHPQQRFGQIICNYLLPDYRNESPGKGTPEIMNYLFPNNPDPFFEESEETYKRICK